MKFQYLLLLLEFSVFTVPQPGGLVWGGFDETRGHNVASTFPASAWSEFKAEIITLFPESTFTSTSRLTLEYLSTVDVFVNGQLSQETGSIDVDEEAALVTWVESGGILISFYEYGPLAEVYKTFTIPFGIGATEIVVGGITNIFSGSDLVGASHELFDGVHNILFSYFSGFSIDNNDAEVLMAFRGQPVMAVLENYGSGNGAVLVISDSSGFMDGVLYTTHKGPNDNGKFTRNIALWANGIRSATFFLVSELDTYDNQAERCIQRGGRLASIHNDVENLEALAACISTDLDGCYIGFRSPPGGSVSSYTWGDGSVADYTNWAGGQPDSVDQPNTVITSTGFWHDVYDPRFYKAVCRKTAVPVCGNGILEPPEKCDDGNLIETDSCGNDCKPGYCGDGIVQPELCEECDDGNYVYGDGCNDCRVTCGDGVWDLDEECDFGSDPGCERDCTYGGAVWQLIKSEHMDPSVFSSASGDLRYFGTLAEQEYEIIEIWGGGYYYRFEPDQVDLFEDTENLYIPITNFETNNKEMERLVTDADGAYFCRAASERQNRKPGDTSWAIVPKNDANRGCGCNSNSWGGRGVYYGGSNPASVCDPWGGGFAGFVEDREQKGGINIGVSIYGGMRESRAESRGDDILVPAEISQECKAAGEVAEETRSEIPDDFFTRTTIIDRPFELEGVEYPAGAVIDGNHVKIEGDIILGYAADVNAAPVIPYKKMLAFEVVGRAWTQCPIPYEIASTDPVQNENALAALTHFEEKTLWSFVERTTEDGWFKFVDGEGTFDCSSFVGRRPLARQPQEITNTGCSVGNLIHEIGHALGMHHEHMRPDRDDHIQIVQNTVDITDPNFAIRQDDKARIFGEYDLRSIMHYGDRTYVNNNDLSWFTARGSVPYGVQIGQREGLSRLDIELANLRFQQVTGGECFPESVSCACPETEFYVGQQVRASRDVEQNGVMISSGDIGRIVCGNELGLFIDWDGLQDGTGSTGQECSDSCGLSEGLTESTGGWAPCEAVRNIFAFDYIIGETLATAADAEEDCVSQGGHLCSIHSDAENELVGSLLQNPFWVGLNDVAAEGQLQWTDGTPFDYEAWGVGEPNNIGGGEDCVEFHFRDEDKWNDIPCTDSRPYICQIPVPLDEDEGPSGERVDRCPASSKLHPGICGCNRLDVDTDGDGILDCKEGCKNDYLRQTPPCKVACGDCGKARKGAGCSVPEIVECVIHKMGKNYESCKTDEWDSYCADVATSECSCGD